MLDFRGHMQNAYVTHDLNKAMAMLKDRFQLDRYDEFTPDMTVNTVDGHQPLQVHVGSFWSGGINVEIIQPKGGYTKHYDTMLPADKDDFVPRFHHVSLRREDEAEMRKEIAGTDMELAFEGPVSIKVAIPSLVFIYMDARHICGHYIEYTWKSPEAWQHVGWPEGRPVW